MYICIFIILHSCTYVSFFSIIFLSRKGTVFWQKNSLITHILIELCLLWYLADSLFSVLFSCSPSTFYFVKRKRTKKGKEQKRKGNSYLLQCQPPIWPTFQNAYNQVYATLTQVIWHFEVTIENGIFQLGHSGAFERHTSGNHKI